MVTAISDVRQTQTHAAETSKVIPLKIGIFSPQGGGKTTTAALIALALSVQYHDRAPVYVTDTEPGWQFLKRLFKIEGVELIQRTTPTFKAMMANMHEAERIGACVYSVDSLSIIWNELMQSFKTKNNGFIPINKWGDIRQMWNDYVTLFLNSSFHALALGRLGNITEEISLNEDNPAETKLMKTGTQFKAGGGESFGYEPHLLLELSTERKPKMKQGSKREGEGRMLHRCDVLKDRTWALNGLVFRWSDKAGYAKGGYSNVWNSIKPHFDLTQETGIAVKIEDGESSVSLIHDDGHSDYYQRRQRRDVLVAEFYAAIDLLWGGQAKTEKQMRLKVFERIFGFRTKESADVASLETIERGVRIIQMFEKRCKNEPDILLQEEEHILSTLDKDIEAYDANAAEEEELELPFGTRN